MTGPVSLDLHVDLEAAGGRRAALERALRTAIRDGRLRPGERVPSTRGLARDLGLARGTVAEAYAQLAAEGYLRTSPGAPTRVATGLAPPAPGDGTVGAAANGPAPAGAPPRFDLRVGVPDVGSFPRAGWLRALRRALAAAPDHALTGGDPRGRPELRAALAAYLGRTRGVIADPAHIVVCAGFTQALGVACHALRDTAGVRALAMEDPCLHQHRAVVGSTGLRIARLAVDDDGARPDPSGPSADAVLLTPAHQFPLGGTLAPERRAAFVGWARARDTVVVEDDYDGEFRYDRQPAGALQGLGPEHVVYTGTASKVLAPGLRLGWLVLPPRLVDPVVEAKRVVGDTQVLEQLALADFIGSGAMDRHVRRMRQRYRRRRDALLDLLRARAPRVRARGIAAGLHVVLGLAPAGLHEDEVMARAADRSLGLMALRPFWHAPPGPGGDGVVVGYAAAPEHAYGQALGVLGDVLAAR
jgi:GntR family transcriptional regulator/MocR family aminotransferase